MDQCCNKHIKGASLLFPRLLCRTYSSKWLRCDTLISFDVFKTNYFYLWCEEMAFPFSPVIMTFIHKKRYFSCLWGSEEPHRGAKQGVITFPPYPAQRSEEAWWDRAPWSPLEANNLNWSPHWEAGAVAWTTFHQTAAAPGCRRHTDTPAGKTAWRNVQSFTNMEEFFFLVKVLRFYCTAMCPEASRLGSLYPVEGDVELCQEKCDGWSQTPDEVHQSAVLRKALLFIAQQVLNATALCCVNMTLEPLPLLSVTQGMEKHKHQPSVSHIHPGVGFFGQR